MSIKVLILLPDDRPQLIDHGHECGGPQHVGGARERTEHRSREDRHPQQHRTEVDQQQADPRPTEPGLLPQVLCEEVGDQCHPCLKYPSVDQCLRCVRLDQLEAGHGEDDEWGDGQGCEDPDVGDEEVVEADRLGLSPQGEYDVQQQPDGGDDEEQHTRHDDGDVAYPWSEDQPYGTERFETEDREHGALPLDVPAEDFRVYPEDDRREDHGHESPVVGVDVYLEHVAHTEELLPAQPDADSDGDAGREEEEPDGVVVLEGVLCPEDLHEQQEGCQQDEDTAGEHDVVVDDRPAVEEGECPRVEQCPDVPAGGLIEGEQAWCHAEDQLCEYTQCDEVYSHPAEVDRGLQQTEVHETCLQGCEESEEDVEQRRHGEWIGFAGRGAGCCCFHSTIVYCANGKDYHDGV